MNKLFLWFFFLGGVSLYRYFPPIRSLSIHPSLRSPSRLSVLWIVFFSGILAYVLRLRGFPLTPFFLGYLPGSLGILLAIYLSQRFSPSSSEVRGRLFSLGIALCLSTFPLLLSSRGEALYLLTLSLFSLGTATTLLFFASFFFPYVPHLFTLCIALPWGGRFFVAQAGETGSYFLLLWVTLLVLGGVFQEGGGESRRSPLFGWFTLLAILLFPLLLFWVLEGGSFADVLRKVEVPFLSGSILSTLLGFSRGWENRKDRILFFPFLILLLFFALLFLEGSEDGLSSALFLFGFLFFDLLNPFPLRKVLTAVGQERFSSPDLSFLLLLGFSLQRIFPDRGEGEGVSALTSSWGLFIAGILAVQSLVLFYLGSMGNRNHRYFSFLSRYLQYESLTRFSFLFLGVVIGFLVPPLVGAWVFPSVGGVAFLGAVSRLLLLCLLGLLLCGRVLAPLFPSSLLLPENLHRFFWLYGTLYYAVLALVLSVNLLRFHG